MPSQDCPHLPISLPCPLPTPCIPPFTSSALLNRGAVRNHSIQSDLLRHEKCHWTCVIWVCNLSNFHHILFLEKALKYPYAHNWNSKHPVNSIFIQIFHNPLFSCLHLNPWLDTLLFMFSGHVTAKSISRWSSLVTKLARVGYRRILEMHGLNVTEHFVSTSGAKLTQVTGKKLPLRILHNMRGDGFFSGS